MEKKSKGIKTMTEFLICLLCAFVGVYVAPTIFNIAIGETNSALFKIILGIMVFGIILYLLITFLAWVEQKNGTFKKTTRKTIKLSAVYILCWFVMSLLFGLMAALSYFVLKQHLVFDQIKGIINLLTAIISFLLLPCFIVMFWRTIKTDKHKWRDYINAITLSCYLKLLIAMLVLYGIGVLITTIFHYAPTGIFKILEMTLLAIVGVAGFTVSDRICQY